MKHWLKIIFNKIVLSIDKERMNIIYSIIKEKIKTVEDVKMMTSQELYYAYKWVEDGSLQVTNDVVKELVTQMCLRGI